MAIEAGDIDCSEQCFQGTKGLIMLGDLALSYVRDDKTSSFAEYIDLAGGGREVQAEGQQETPFTTFERETREEFGLEIRRAQIVHHAVYPAMLDPTQRGYFVVAHLPLAAAKQINFGNEGYGYLITPLEYLLEHDLMIPVLKSRIQDYLIHTGQQQFDAAVPVSPQVMAA